MRKTMMAVLVAGAVSMSACATNSEQAGNIAQGAGIGAAGGAVVGAIVPGVNVIEGAAIGAGVGGLAGAVWADNNGDGYTDGYVQNGTYYQGTPQGYDPTLRRVVTTAVGGAALGAVAGAVIPGLSVVEGAVVGAAIGGLAGAVWADNDRDGRTDGYVYNGQYYQGTPQGYTPQAAPAPMHSGERG
nr:YMGG-like glycine zipper-containing protein [uncultured Sphingomonas sp.]